MSHHWAYIARVQDRSIISADLWEHVTLIQKQSVHIPDEAKVVLVPRGLTYRRPPFFDGFEDLALHSRRAQRRSLWEASD